MSYIIERRTLQSTIENVNNLLDLSEPVLIKTLLFGSNSFDTKANTNVLSATIEHVRVLSTTRFEKPLFNEVSMYMYVYICMYVYMYIYIYIYIYSSRLHFWLNTFPTDQASNLWRQLELASYLQI